MQVSYYPYLDVYVNHKKLKLKFNLYFIKLNLIKIKFFIFYYIKFDQN